MILWFLSLGTITHSSAQNFTSYKVGNITDIISAPAGGVCLMGGATENDQAMRWFLQNANSGDVVVLRATGGSGYNAYFYSQLGVALNSVETFVIPNSAGANDAYVVQQVLNAEAIWIAGGNQSTYVNQWKNTALDSAIQFVIHQKNIAIGGTSAGMAILGQGYFSAIQGTISSASALANPFDPTVTLGWSDFINHPRLESTITDTHFDNPDRRGRLLTFLARLQDTTQSSIKAIACDEYTAVCIDSQGMARVYGEWPLENDNAYFVQVNCQLPNVPEVIQQGQPLTWQRNGAALKVYNIKGDTAGSGTFNTQNWVSGTGGNWLHWSVSSGIFSSQTGTPAQLCTIQSIQTSKENTIELNTWYPNPSQFIDLAIPSDWEHQLYKISLYNSLGKILLNTNAYPGEHFGKETLSSGIYFLNVKNASNRLKLFKLFLE